MQGVENNCKSKGGVYLEPKSRLSHASLLSLPTSLAAGPNRLLDQQ